MQFKVMEINGDRKELKELSECKEMNGEDLVSVAKIILRINKEIEPYDMALSLAIKDRNDHVDSDGKVKPVIMKEYNDKSFEINNSKIDIGKPALIPLKRAKRWELTPGCLAVAFKYGIVELPDEDEDKSEGEK